MKLLPLLVVLSTVISFSAVAKPGMSEGEELHNESCGGCHTFSMYLRPTSTIKNKFDLRRQVSYCRSHLDVDWFPDEEASVVDYLNQNFYQLEK